MTIKLDCVFPTFIQKRNWDNSGIWGKDINFEPNSYIQIIAASGSGKTSLIHFLYGLRKDYVGNIQYENENIKLLNIEQLSIFRQQTISIVFQDLRLFKEHTARENIEFKRQLCFYHEKGKITEMASHLGVADKLDHKINTCSYGEQQRIAIIRSLMQPFDFLFLDEPFSHLDDLNKIKAMDLILAECNQRNASIIFADLKINDFFTNQIIYEL